MKMNTAANFIGFGYTTIIGLVILPRYLHYLGAEAFGMVGFFTLLQAWMQLLDLGMSPMLSRQAAQAQGHGKYNDFIELKRLMRSLELILFALSLGVVIGISAGSSWVANKWLHVTSLPLKEVATCIELMGGMIGLRLFTSLYRSGIQGMEHQIGLNIANMLLATIKFIGALLLLRFVTQNVVYFFAYQLLVGFVEIFIMGTMFYRVMPTTEKIGIRFYWNTLKPVVSFAGGIAYSAGIWILLTQLDKLILSNVLSLSEYGYFALVVVVATGINQISSPISQAILPRLTYLLSQGKEQDMLALYRNATQFMAVIILPVTGVIAIFSNHLIFAWTGDRKAAEWAGPILLWFALGNGILAISTFQYYLQYAHGKVRMHVIYNSISASIQIPLIVYTAYTYGALGVAFMWFGLRLISFIIWTPIVHHKFAPGIHWSWLSKDVAPILISTTAALIIIYNIHIGFDGMGKGKAFVVLICLGMMVLSVNMLVSSASRAIIISTAKKAMS